MAEQNLSEGDRGSEFWAKRAHDRGELLPELRKLFYEYLDLGLLLHEGDEHEFT